PFAEKVISPTTIRKITHRDACLAFPAMGYCSLIDGKTYRKINLKPTCFSKNPGVSMLRYTHLPRGSVCSVTEPRRGSTCSATQSVGKYQRVSIRRYGMPLRSVKTGGDPESEAVAGGQLAPQYPVIPRGSLFRLTV